MNRTLPKLLALTFCCWLSLVGLATAAGPGADAARLVAVRARPGGDELVVGTRSHLRRLYKVPATRGERFPGQRTLSDTAVSADGREALVSQVGAVPYHALVVVDLASGRARLLQIHHRYGEHPAFLAGGKIVFSSPDVRKPPGSNIAHDHPGGTYLLDPRTGSMERLFARPEIAASPDGRWFLAKGSGPRGLVLLDRAGRVVRRLAPRASRGSYLEEAAFSPQGERILLTERSSATDDGTLYLASGDGTARRRLTHGLGSVSGASFSPDGRRVIYTLAGEGGGAGEIRSASVRRPAVSHRESRETAFEFPVLLP